MNKINKAKDFIIKNIYIICIICIIITYLVYNYVFSTYIELLENVKKDTTLENIIDKEIYLKYRVQGDKKKDNEFLYLSVSPKVQCENIKKSTIFECLKNVAILRPGNEKFAKFKISKIPKSDPVRYTLKSTSDELKPRNVFSQTINFLKVKGQEKATVPACFDKGKDDVVRLEIIEENGELKLVFRKKEKEVFDNYYVGKCPVKMCNQGTKKWERLCIFKGLSKAITFIPVFVQNKTENEEK